MFWDYRDLPKPVQWAIFILSILIIRANAVTIVLLIITTHLDTDGFATTTLIVVSSTILHIFQVMLTPPHNCEMPILLSSSISATPMMSFSPPC
ncbi:hypothetical protein FRB93_007972 [Tulasnella sp. JGI-2019a]|nr:hypothetical protein FRB93_007972 [Tulasnella sp. JGI-2019a]